MNRLKLVAAHHRTIFFRSFASLRLCVKENEWLRVLQSPQAGLARRPKVAADARLDGLAWHLVAQQPLQIAGALDHAR